jgi:hypothetical protein
MLRQVAQHSLSNDLKANVKPDRDYGPLDVAPGAASTSSLIVPDWTF